MCTRYALRLKDVLDAVSDDYPSMQLDKWINADAFIPSYNFGATSQGAVIVREEVNAFSSQRQLVIQTMQWNLVPDWRAPLAAHTCVLKIPAENIIRSSTMCRKRCAIICQGYYKWWKKGKNEPIFVKREDRKLMLLAGIYDITEQGFGEERRSVHSFAFVSVNPREELAWLDVEQPVILSSPAHIDAWLNLSCPSSPEKLTNIVLHSNDEVSLEWYRVPNKVGRTGAEDPAFIERISRWEGSLDLMFAKMATKAASASYSSRTEDPRQEEAFSDSPERYKGRSKGDYAGINPELLKTPKKKRRRAETTQNAEDSDSDMQIIENPSPTLRSDVHKQLMKKRKSRKKPKPSFDDPSGSKGDEIPGI